MSASLRETLLGLLCAVTLLCVVLPSSDARAASYHVILCGSGGEVEFSVRYKDWGTRLQDALVNQLGVPADRVVLLTEGLNEDPPPLVTTSLESIRDTFEALSKQVKDNDDLFTYFIGHGSYLKNVSKFHIPGKDLTAEKFDRLLKSIPAKRLIVMNGTSSSAGFVNVLSGEGRIICVATKSVSEINATEFMGFFIEGLEDGSADRNHDERISILEACEQASELTASWYVSESLISTEHALLDDNGDGLGSRLPIEVFAVEPAKDSDKDAEEILDGALARECFVKDYSFHADVPQELIDTYLGALDAVVALRSNKSELAEDEYFAQLEEILLKAARANREIRSIAAQAGADS